MSEISKEELLNFLSESEKPQTKRDLARAFQIKGDQRIPFKKLLKELEADGVIVKQSGGAYSIPDALPTVTVIEISDVTIDGDLLAKPIDWQENLQGPMPRIEVQPPKKGHADVAPGDRVLARLIREHNELYEAKIIRRMDTPQNRVLGLVKQNRRNFVLEPVNKKAKYNFGIPQADLGPAREGDIVVAEVQPSRGAKQKNVHVIEVIGQEDDVKAISLIALHETGLREKFCPDAIRQTEGMRVPDLKGRTDLRDIPLVTIDGADAKDFDDAVFAEKHDDGFHLIVAIADLSYYVSYKTALDEEAYARGNSTYFPDRVVPMLPEALSNDLCSLRPKENRACMVMHMWIDGHGKLKKYRVERGIMRSAARLVYEQVQAAMDGQTDDVTGPLMEPVIRPLYEAYAVLSEAREKRGTLDLDLPERQIIIGENGHVDDVKKRQRLDAHKLIEEFMILANVAAARALEDRKAPCTYRVHEKPDGEKLAKAREFIRAFGISMPKGQVMKPGDINGILKQADDMPFSHLIHETILRTQSQARYDTENCGHFGLALQKYAHFTSPIRRYADLLVHRSLVRAYGLGPGGLSDEEATRLEEMCEHISQTERLSMEAERSATDRFIAMYLSEQSSIEFEGQISGVTKFGLFVRLNESGADGLVPIRTLPNDYYIHDESQHALIGRNTGRLYRMGAAIRVRLVEADALTGSTVLEVIGDKGADIPGFTMAPPKINQNRRPPHKKYGKGGPKNRKKGGKGPFTKKNKGRKPPSKSNKN